MNLALRAARTRWRLVLATGLTGSLAVAGPTACATGNDLEGVTVAGPVLLLALVALCACGREMVSARRHETTVARLRGVHGFRLAGALLVEPLVVLAAGGACGLAVAGALRAMNGTDVPWPKLALLAGGIVLVGASVLLAVLLTAGNAPLSRHLRDRHLVAGALPGGTVALVLVFVASVVVVQRALATGDEEPDWLLLLAPAVLGLAAGQVAIWLLNGAGRLVASRSTTSTPGFLAARRIARLRDGDGVRSLVAASVVAVVALTGTGIVSAWVDESAALRAGAPRQVTVDGGALEALRLSRSLDPEGRWLMAAELTTGEGSPTQVLVDTSRYRRVVAGLQQDTRASEVTGHLDRLVPEAGTQVVQVATGSSMAVAVEGSARGSSPVKVTVEYLNDENYTEETVVPVVPGDTATRRLPRCADGCAIASLRIEGPARVSYRFVELEFGGVDLTSVPWQSAGTSSEPGRLTLSTDRSGRARATPVVEPVPVVRAGAHRATLLDGNGEPRPVTVVGTSAALPLAQGQGVLGDLPRTLAVATPSAVASRAMVLARADTPAVVRDALEEAAGTRARETDDFRADIRNELGEGKVRARLAVGFLCLGLVVPVLLASARRRRSEARRAAGSLRLLGIPSGLLRAAVRRELVVAVTTIVALTVVGGIAAVWWLSPALLPEPPGSAVPLETGPRALPLLGVTAVAGALWLPVVLPARRSGLCEPRPVDLVWGEDGD